ncbi:hypothetical protein [Sphingobacterium multivorum]|uniref:hypothetical protein n=1 Tax=Sphingobacterium multivorum TaxID=28454 RepID=UPI0028A69205|nr:hypothetical protein [Sphingobacterium multivorum]
MINTEILKKIESIQYAIDMFISTNGVKFNNTKDLKILEEIYNEITGRRYSKFDGGCGSCVKEALIITNNWKKRELKNNPEVVEFTIESIQEAIEEKPASEEKEETKPIQKPKTNGRKRK